MMLARAPGNDQTGRVRLEPRAGGRGSVRGALPPDAAPWKWFEGPIYRFINRKNEASMRALRLAHRPSRVPARPNGCGGVASAPGKFGDLRVILAAPDKLRHFLGTRGSPRMGSDRRSASAASMAATGSARSRGVTGQTSAGRQSHFDGAWNVTPGPDLAYQITYTPVPEPDRPASPRRRYRRPRDRAAPRVGAASSCAVGWRMGRR